MPGKETSHQLGVGCCLVQPGLRSDKSRMGRSVGIRQARQHHDLARCETSQRQDRRKAVVAGQVRRAPPRGVWLNAPDHQCLMRRAGRTGAEDAMGMSTCERRAGGFTRSRFCSTSCGRGMTSSGCVRCNQAKPEGFALIDPWQRLSATCSGPAFRVYRSTAMPLCFMARQRGATVEPRRPP